MEDVVGVSTPFIVVPVPAGENAIKALPEATATPGRVGLKRKGKAGCTDILSSELKARFKFPTPEKRSRWQRSFIGLL